MTRFETPNVHVDIFDRHRVILDGEECELVQVAVYREGRPEDMLGFDANSTLVAPDRETGVRGRTDL